MNHFVWLAAATDSATDLAARKFGEAVGSGLVLLLLFLGIIKCASIMRRPTTNKLCVTALLVALLGWLLSTVGNMLSVVLQVPDGVLKGIAGVLGALLLMAALVLGIIGLATYDRNRFKQGRAQAVWAIVMGSLVVVASVGAMVMTAVKSARMGDGMARTPAGTAIKKTEFNFSVTPPARWVEIKPETVNKLACLALRRTNPEVYCLVIGERLGDSIQLEQLREIAKANLASAAHVLEQSEETLELNGVTFSRLNTRARLETASMTAEYEHWLATQRGFSWQFVFWMREGERATLGREARAMMETFHVLDPALEGIGKGTVADVERRELGYRTQLDGLGWASWKNATGNALIDFRAQRSNEALVVVPVRFDSEPPDLEAITCGLLSTLDFQNTPEEEIEIKPWTPGNGGTGQEMQIEREVDGDRFHYILRVARGVRSAHLIAGWTAVPKGDLNLVRRSLDAITLMPPRAPRRC